MPRPRVLPENRRRSVHACQPCRESKKKCDARLPCSHCIQRNIHSLCTFSEKNRHFHRHRRQLLANASNASLEAPCELPGMGFTSTYPSTSDTNNTTASPDPPDPPSEICAPRETDMEPTTRMLQNSDGERVFFGKHGSLAFLQLLREIVAKRIGASEFSHNADCDVMLEAELVYSGQFDVQDFPSQHHDLEEMWIDNFWTATNGIIEVVDRDEACELIHTPDIEFENMHPLRYAVKMMIISIGIQCSGNKGQQSLEDQVHFIRAREAAFASFLENSCADMIRVFLLMSFYMLGACRRNTATMYLSIAAQSANILGLHNPDTHRSTSINQTNDLFRLWKSLVSLDIIVNSILGRPLLISPSEWNISHISSPNNSFESSTMPLDATYKLSLIIRKDLVGLIDKKGLSVELVECHLKNLKVWTTNLPTDLQLSSVPECPRPEAQLRIIGSLHISCFYYFSVIIATRPFLIPFLLRRLPDGQHIPELDVKATASQEAKLAHTCLNSAIYMIQTCSEVMDSGFLLRNMCIIKAWIFAAALVVGLHLFATFEADVEAEDAFTRSRAVLQVFAKDSPQAAHYLEILNLLNDAIKKQHQPKTPERQLNPDLLLNRIMRLEAGVPVAFVEDLDSEGFPSVAPQSGASTSSTGGIEISQDMQRFEDCPDFNWDEDIVRFWDFCITNAQPEARTSES